MTWLLFTGVPQWAAKAQGTSESKPEKPMPVLSRPSCLKCPPPEFPDKARKAKIQSARVLLEITVSTEGSAADVQVLSDPGYGFADKAVEAVKRWKFKPLATEDGKQVPARIKIEITFRQ